MRSDHLQKAPDWVLLHSRDQHIFSFFDHWCRDQRVNRLYEQ